MIELVELIRTLIELATKGELTDEEIRDMRRDLEQRPPKRIAEGDIWDDQ